MKSPISYSVLFCLFFNSLTAQIGITAGYVNLAAPEFQQGFNTLSDLTTASKDYDQGTYQVAVDYWFRLKNKRIEFLPEVSFMNASALVESELGIDAAYSNDLNFNMLQFNFNTQIYPFDFAGDCDCPTFSKDGDILKKGFFIRIAPGISSIQFQNDRTDISIAGSETMNLKESAFAYNLRAGFGLDIGVSDFFTITPLAQYTLVSKSEPVMAYENPAFTANQNQSTFRQFFLGVRLEFRFDELNKYGFR